SREGPALQEQSQQGCIHVPADPTRHRDEGSPYRQFPTHQDERIREAACRDRRDSQGVGRNDFPDRPATQLSNSIHNPQPEERIDVRAAVGRLWARRWWIFGSIIFFTTLSVAAAFLMEPVYRSTCVLVPADSERQGLSSALAGAVGSLGGLASLAGVDLGPRSQQTEEAL